MKSSLRADPDEEGEGSRRKIPLNGIAIITSRNSTIAQFRRLRSFKHPAADLGKFRH